MNVYVSNEKVYVLCEKKMPFDSVLISLIAHGILGYSIQADIRVVRYTASIRILVYVSYKK